MRRTVNEKILAQVAKNNGVSIEEVRREIGFAFDAAKANPNTPSEFWERLGESATRRNDDCTRHTYGA